MITLITGNLGCGKTTKAVQMTENRKTVWLNERALREPFCFQSVTPETECIVIDELVSKNAINMFLSSDKLQIERENEAPEMIDMPDIIIISGSLNKNDFLTDNVKIIDLSI